jgi:hypothetical protein
MLGVHAHGAAVCRMMGARRCLIRAEPLADVTAYKPSCLQRHPVSTRVLMSPGTLAVHCTRNWIILNSEDT